MTEFIKYDNEKLRWTLLPFEALAGVVQVLEFGAAKYARDNWKQCEDPERYLNAGIRHLVALLSGEEVDSESGLLHKDHLLTNIIFYCYLTQNSTP